MYAIKSGLLIGFHGCDEIVRDNVISGKTKLETSKNKYDWLGNGIYFWENNHRRALQFATELKENPRRGKTIISNPAVVGGILSLGRCLDLLDSEYLELLRETHKILELSTDKLDYSLPVNRKIGGSEDLLLRNLDCLVIEHLHKLTDNLFDSVRGVFVEGTSLYPTSGFKDKNHIQICIRNPNCIKGYFVPLDADVAYNEV